MDLTFLALAAAQILSVQTIAYALAAMGLSLQFGFTGLLNFGQAGFMAVGGYCFAITTVILGWPIWASFLIAIAGCVLFALILGIPTLRLRADYLAITTIAAAEIVRYSVQTPGISQFTGGPDGINGAGRTFDELNPIPPGVYGVGAFSLNAQGLFIAIVGWSFVILAGLLLWRLVHSPWGRVIKAIREDEDAVRSLGKNVYLFKLQALIIGGVLGGIACIILIIPTSLQPNNFGTQTTFFLVTIMLLGGATTVIGPVLGAVIFWVVLSLSDGALSLLVSQDLLPISSVQQGPIRFIIVGVALMLIVVFKPQGILGKKRETYFSA